MEDDTAVLVIRAWREAGASAEEIRARLTQEGGAGYEQHTAAGEEAILDAVRAWLRAFTER